jgi:hypothetical protein
MLRAESFLLHRQRSLVEAFGVRVAVLPPVEQGEVVEVRGQGDVLGPQDLFLYRQRPQE